MIKRIGFKSNLYEYDANNNIVINKKYVYDMFRLGYILNTPFEIVIERITTRLKLNINVTKNILTRISTCDPNQRFVCIDTRVLQLYNEGSVQWYWQLPEIKTYLEVELFKLGEIARNNDIRIILYADYYSSIMSLDEKKRKKAFNDIEKQATIAKLMGFGQTFHDCDIIVPLYGELPIDHFRSMFNNFSPELKNCIVLSNMGTTHGIENCIALSDLCPCSIDLFNHLMTTGEYIQSNDNRIKQIIDSWNGIRPMFGYSGFDEQVLSGHDPNIFPDIAQLIGSGIKKKRLSTHGNFLWNNAMNDWALTHLELADCMVHMKAGFLASTEFYEYSKLKSADSF